jgi:hypothetical protein
MFPVDNLRRSFIELVKRTSGEITNTFAIASRSQRCGVRCGEFREFRTKKLGEEVCESSKFFESSPPWALRVETCTFLL